MPVQTLMVSVIANTSINIKDMTANEPNQVGEVGCRCLVRHKFEHCLVVQLSYILYDLLEIYIEQIAFKKNEDFFLSLF